MLYGLFFLQYFLLELYLVGHAIRIFRYYAYRFKPFDYPVNLHLVRAPRAWLSVFTARFEGVTQLPCRVVAEME